VQTCDAMHYENFRKDFKDKANVYINAAKKDKVMYLVKLSEYIDYCDNMNDFFI
jgi:hypothetical protein